MPSLPMTSPAPAHRHQGAVRLGTLHVAPYPERWYQEAERPDLPLECTPRMPRDFILSLYHLTAPLLGINPARVCAAGRVRVLCAASRECVEPSGPWRVACARTGVVCVCVHAELDRERDRSRGRAGDQEAGIRGAEIRVSCAEGEDRWSGRIVRRISGHSGNALSASCAPVAEVAAS